ncbi:MAG: gliding motility-associated C-terminal domain-containing protein [Bacteroidia bacterium]|nr:gliding motility-associated C-terminal domain-containing protein [Bacteroidia bacterium]
MEICDNALDDDGDGLIDLRDPDCECPVIEPISLIPNPSFEDQLCCPSQRAQMNCAETWIQASEPTTDYLHTCGWMGWDGMPVPLPIPDGQACVGFRNGRFGLNGNNANWKEYAGACLTGPLLANIEYKFQFYIGFTNSENSPPTNIVFYGTTNCNNLPFGIGNEYLGCPTNAPGWKQLGSVAISGSNQWKLMEINVVPTEDIYAIAIGPDCIEITYHTSTYYFFDNLLLADQASFDFDIKPTGSLCSNFLSLIVPANDTIEYQWYKNGIALIGETQNRLLKMHGNGNYQVMTNSPLLGCRVSGNYEYIRPEYHGRQSVTICEGETYRFDNQLIDSGGVYYDTLKTAFNCDSIVELNLHVSVDTAVSVDGKIFPTEFYQVGSAKYYTPGTYTTHLKTEYGCDSTVVLNLSYYDFFAPNAFSPNDDGINDIFTVMGSEDMESIENLKVFNRWGNLIYDVNGLSPNDQTVGWDGYAKGGPSPEGVYIFMANIRYDDGRIRTTSGSFTLLR